MKAARLILFASGLAIVLALIIYAGLDAVGRALASLGLVGLALVALMHVPVLLLLGTAWWCVGHGIPGARRVDFLAARWARDSAGEILPFSQLGGFAIGVRVLSLAGLELSRAALSLFADLLAEISAKLPYMAAGALALLWIARHTAVAVPLLFVLALSLVGLAAAVAYRDALGRLVQRSAARLLRRWTGGRPLPAVGSDGNMMRSAALHLLCWFFGAAETWVVFALMHRPVSFVEALVIDSLVSVLRMFGLFVPAAAGVQEGSYVVVCALFGITPASAVAFSLARRARDLLLGTPAVALWQISEARSVAKKIFRREPQAPAGLDRRTVVEEDAVR